MSSNKAIVSRYDGFCKKCKSKWQKGDNIVRDDGLGTWVHLKCPSNNGKGKTFKQMLTTPAKAVAEEGEDIIEQIGKKVFIPSDYQQAIFDWAISGTGNGVAEAVAGSGKTTTIVKMLDILPSSFKILFLAFNKRIVANLKSRVPKHIRVATLHSLGFSVIRKLADFRDLDKEKVSKIMDEFWKVSKQEVPDPKVRSANYKKRRAMRTVVSMVKATLVDYNDPNQILDIINRFHIEMDEMDEQEVIERLPYVMEKNNENTEYIDYDDMCYLPVVDNRLKLHFDKYDFILVDEGQDLNLCNVELVINCLAPNGRMLVVGDRFQSLYAFRGADPRAIPTMIKRLDAKVLPLSISYRCPRSHVERIKHLVPQIESAPGAKDGWIKTILHHQLTNILEEGAKGAKNQMVLCRTNAPLVKPAFELIKRDIKATIVGADIGKDLINFIERFQADDLGHLEILMAEFVEREVERLLSKNRELQAEDLKDKFDTIVTVSHECISVTDLILKLQTLFSDDNIGVSFSSVHRAKGLEAEDVFILHPELFPHPKAKGEDELQQEANCEYVAGTRSLDTIYIVLGDENG